MKSSRAGSQVLESLQKKGGRPGAGSSMHSEWEGGAVSRLNASAAEFVPQRDAVERLESEVLAAACGFDEDARGIASLLWREG